MSIFNPRISTPGWDALGCLLLGLFIASATGTAPASIQVVAVPVIQGCYALAVFSLWRKFRSKPATDSTPPA